jgi:hypothetical protein
LRQATTHGKQAKIKAGRHAAPAKPRHVPSVQLNKLVKRAALVAPAAAVAIAVVATVQAQGPASAAPADAAGRVPAASQAHAGRQAHSDGRPHPGRASQSPASKPSPARSRSAAAKPAGRPAASPAPSHQAATGSHGSTLHCSGSSVMLPENYVTIVSFLTSHGYTRLAAAGMAGNMYQESKGNPESVGTGGGGLIGWTPLPPGFVTGNPAADLKAQLAAVLTYNQQWSQYIPALNAATSATQAADIYMTYFERPGIPAAANREGAAAAVASACGF